METLANIIGYVVLFAFLILLIVLTLGFLKQNLIAWGKGFRCSKCDKALIRKDWANNFSNFIAACIGGPLTDYFKCVFCGTQYSEYDIKK